MSIGAVCCCDILMTLVVDDTSEVVKDQMVNTGILFRVVGASR